MKLIQELPSAFHLAIAPSLLGLQKGPVLLPLLVPGLTPSLVVVGSSIFIFFLRILEMVVGIGLPRSFAISYLSLRDQFKNSDNWVSISGLC